VGGGGAVEEGGGGEGKRSKLYRMMGEGKMMMCVVCVCVRARDLPNKEMVNLYMRKYVGEG
jgi:hypothetical protein